MPNMVSVPIRGLFNLTVDILDMDPEEALDYCFRPHQGII